MTQQIIERAISTMRRNDKGEYTVPTHGLYPFQWNWDSCLSALGFQHFDEARAWTEIETLFAHQWDDGMVPHIIFHEEDEGYFPGPDVWNTGRKVPTSGITQPPVAGFCVWRLFERAQDKALAAEKARDLLPKIHEWHRWFFRCRDPEGTGLVALIHPWESGRDNSVDWDEALGRVSTDKVGAFQRRDTEHADTAHRPTQSQYKAYIALVELFRDAGWDNERLHDLSPFRVVDPGFNAILLRSCADLAKLAAALGQEQIAAEAMAHAKAGLTAMETLWDERSGQYLCWDRVTHSLIQSLSIGGILATVAPIPAGRASAIARRIEFLAGQAEWLVPSHDPSAPEFDARRYWRGPVWLIVNYMIADGLFQTGEHALAKRVFAQCVKLIEESGFAEYYDPRDGHPCGGGDFTWTAAMIVEILNQMETA